MSNPDVWVLIPTAQKEHVPAQLSKWTGRGYRAALWVDFMPSQEIHQFSELKIQGPYPGVWRAWNALAKTVFAAYGRNNVVVLAGDDMDPDPNHTAQEIARQYLERFPTGDGVMQPCGDPQGKAYSDTHSGGAPAAARICGSPWLGYDWVTYAYSCRGPVNGEYVAFFADEELKLVAERANRLWMRPDLSHFHRHWSWGHAPRQDYHERNQKSWSKDKDLFEQRKAQGFPVC